MSKSLRESNILLCGSSRVGKTTLINAICQEKLAESSRSLNSSTKKIDQYSFKCSIDDLIHETIFWDTPGIESWNENDIHNYMDSLIEKSRPICMIYCASPGSFALLDQLVWIISECQQKNIFCALVCTNMWAGKNRQILINELCQILNRVYPEIKSNKEDGIIYYDRVALVTMVNSIEYIDKDFGIKKPPSGINELIFGIGKCLERDFMFAWLRTVSHNKSFLTKMSSKLSDLLQIPYDKFNTLCQHAENFLEYLFTFPEDDEEYTTASSFSPTRSTSIDNRKGENIFYDAEMIEIPEDSHKYTLQFTLKSKEDSVELSYILDTLGAKKINVVPSEITDEPQIRITAKKNTDLVYGIMKSDSVIPGVLGSNIPDPNNELDRSAIRYWLKFSDFYQWPHITYYNSTDDLVIKLTIANLAEISENMKIYNKNLKRNLFEQWRQILGRIAEP